MHIIEIILSLTSYLQRNSTVQLLMDDELRFDLYKKIDLIGADDVVHKCN